MATTEIQNVAWVTDTPLFHSHTRGEIKYGKNKG